MIMPIILFGVGGMMLLFAYLIGVRKMYNLISGVNTATAEQKVKMALPALCRAMGIGFAVYLFHCASFPSVYIQQHPNAPFVCE